MLSNPSPISTQLTISNVYPDQWFNEVPEAGRFIAAGLLGNIVFFLIDYILYNKILVPSGKKQLLPKVISHNMESSSFFLSYLLQTGVQHLFNAFLVYGLETIETRKKYIDTLVLTYSSYSVSMVGSTIGNMLLIKQGVPKNIAFWGTIMGFGFVNFFLLKFLVGGGQDEATEEGKQEKSKKSNLSKKDGANNRSKVLRKVRGGYVQKQKLGLDLMYGRELPSSDSLLETFLSNEIGCPEMEDFMDFDSGNSKTS
eukprot:CAMPEP_0194089684 /NCGR_PEP_ID=MMETSP0149-20130528/35620_1 /TAXON_ID=122233 /ORGANISM="Chaetoceros debilis, Strain MM31A-1" /LENGTH=254 /DNA_ID=CAMNT_0038773699 /DNA_START=101 /DNA_END=862 /DNA_ORIENTATION=+